MYTLPFKRVFGVLSLCIYLIFGFWMVLYGFLRVDLAFFAYDYVATLI